MIPRVLCTLVALSLTVFVNAQDIEVGDAVTPIPETVVEVDEYGVEWIEVPGVEEPAVEETSTTESSAEPTSTEEVPPEETTAPLGKRAKTFGRRGGGGGPGGGPQQCRKLEVRKEWRDITNHQKASYISAVKCLQSTRAFNWTLPSKFTRYDEFVIAHTEVADYIHGVAQFLPWHRHFGYLYHQALKDVCNYRGPFVYWDWTRDTSGNNPIANSPVFSATTGFGGGGETGTYTMPNFPDDGSAHPLFVEAFTGPGAGCISNGPFKNTIVHYGPNRRASDHCIVRKFEETLRPVLSPANVNNILSQTTYDNFWNSLDGIPFKPDPHLHDAGHGFVGGDMASYYTSNNDPIFYLHHAGVDRVWWKWQSANLSQRLYQMNGQTSPYPPHGEITLDWVLPFTNFAPNVKVRATMDPRNEPYCYTY